MPRFGDPSVWLKETFVQAGLSSGISILLSTLTLVVFVFLLSWLSNFIAKSLIRNIVSSVVKKTTSTWDDIFLEQKVFTRMSHFAPALVIWFMAGWALKAYPTWLLVVQRLTYMYMVIAGTIVVLSFINAWHHIYNTLPISQHRQIKGYVQVVKLFVYIITSLIIFSVLFRKDISTVVAGLGAMAAVLLLIFKDTLLGLAASVQLSANDMLKVGDWITIPGRNVDGTVTDITLTTVKIRNLDKTIITVPTYSLVNESFQNWKGMEEARWRQVKKPLMIDVKSVRFMDEELKAKLSKYELLKEYIETFEKQGRLGNDTFFNQGLLTNLGVFRKYAELYIRRHPLTDQGQVVIMQHRALEANGLLLQVGFFSTGYQPVPYENMQAEIFEHLIAILNEFDLKLFQYPTGYDVMARSDTHSNN